MNSPSLVKGVLGEGVPRQCIYFGSTSFCQIRGLLCLEMGGWRDRDPKIASQALQCGSSSHLVGWFPSPSSLPGGIRAHTGLLPSLNVEFLHPGPPACGSLCSNLLHLGTPPASFLGSILASPEALPAVFPSQCSSQFKPHAPPCDSVCQICLASRLGALGARTVSACAADCAGPCSTWGRTVQCCE